MHMCIKGQGTNLHNRAYKVVLDLPDSSFIYRDGSGGGSWGADDPPSAWQASEKLSHLAKLQLFQTFSSYCSIMKHSKLISKFPNLIEIELFTFKKQLIASRSRQLGGVVNQLVGVSKILRAHSALIN